MSRANGFLSDPHVMFGMAAKELASKLTTIDHINVGGDGLGPMLRDLMEAGTRRLEAKKG